ncbi:MAG TPA: YifB family Mg chelatase-like AAA ATPase [Elusimicrobiota bacterium]|nr:YifB family Mg chelatase-like AAA ATPase [Elusimicrobiota bacterium]
MLSQVFSATTQGIHGLSIQVEVDITPGLPHFATVGLPDAAVKEAKDRVVSAVRNSGFDFPMRKVVVNLSPADVKKEGTAFDLPIAVGVLASQRIFSTDRLSKYVMVGELALDGHVRPVRGLLPIAEAVKAQGAQGLIFPAQNYPEGALAEGIELVPVSTLKEAADFLRGTWTPDLSAYSKADPEPLPAESQDFSEVRGQFFAKRALEIAAAGGHNVMLIGPPGSGKTMLAKRVPSILPPMTFEEALEVTKIHSVAGFLPRGHSLVRRRPFRSPHHTISDVAVVGGGAVPRPGEVSLAHGGVLFLDELLEFNRHVLEVLRQPLEDGCVTISRAATALTFPSRFMLIAAMNPCPCGYQGHPDRDCVCSPFQIQKYRSKISGPLLDRIDMHVEVPALPLRELADELPPGESSETIRARVLTARRIQEGRLSAEGIFANAQMGSRHIKQFCRIQESARGFLKTVVARLGLSARSYDRVLKLSRTIADLSSSEIILDEHVAEAVQYRQLDRYGVLAQT